MERNQKLFKVVYQTINEGLELHPNERTEVLKVNRKITSIITIVAIIITSLLATSCNNTQEENPGSYTPEEESPPISDTDIPEGETRRYSYHNLEIELTNVRSQRTETVADDGGNKWEYTVIIYYPGAKLTVINADMSDAAYSADEKAHPQWGIQVDSDTNDRIDIIDDMNQLDITSDMKGIFNLEASLYVFRFERYKD